MFDNIPNIPPPNLDHLYNKDRLEDKALNSNIDTNETLKNFVEYQVKSDKKKSRYNVYIAVVTTLALIVGIISIVINFL